MHSHLVLLILFLCPKMVSECETSKGRGQSVADTAQAVKHHVQVDYFMLVRLGWRRGALCLCTLSMQVIGDAATSS